jgi:formyltetrahydrofolate synthetase
MMAAVEIFSANSTTEAHLVKGLLAHHGIESEVTGHYLQGAFGELPVTNMIRVIVDSSDEQRARDIIEKYDRGEFVDQEDNS